ncbi:hybrid sensor histidine kinase/response regulator [Geobacter pickeringii]|uniref:histidine kinase n=1 Tax=Geobacter pickeringii TaxID=345632 RepID=A0A0B5B639_9BACT|nr:hybrid sensor histidine kinase/response regulator [Geobacter pickeringii]AJE02012.1 chemotaxis protein CheA [Geobacter pickeringii]
MTDKSRYLDIFLREAGEHVSGLQKGLLELERDPDDRTRIRELMRNAHTVKGSARLLGYDGIGAVSSRLEDLLDEIAAGKRRADPPTVDLLLAGTDALARLLDAVGRGEDSAFDIAGFLAAFDRGEIPVGGVTKSAGADDGAFGDTVRAGVKTLDRLLNRLGELLIGRRRIEERLSSLGEIAEGLDAAAAAALRQFHRGLEEEFRGISALAQELHGDALALRMLPLSTITDGFDRMVRDLAREQGKEVEFRVTGGSVELDRALLEELRPVLLHLLRNAVDHGIEPQDDRILSGKPLRGTIAVAARHEGNSVLIEVRDDGRGIDPIIVREAAVRKGIVSKEEAELLSDDEARYLVMAPGFSTRDFITDVSGRGVGMDVVRQNVDRVKGEFVLRSAPGSFTEIALKLPLTLAVLDAMLVQSDGETYALPLAFVAESFKVAAGEIATAGGREVVTLRGTTIPLVPLAALLAPGERPSIPPSGRIEAIVVRYREQFLACSVDRVIGSTEVVVKGVGDQLKGASSLSGATILGDGTPAPILSVPWLFSRAEKGVRTGYRQAAAELQAARTRGTILVVDDSLTTRAMEQGILVSRGYAAEVAISGEDALEKIRRQQFDLVVTDIQMPGIDGFELTRRLRAIPDYREVPVIVVTSLSRDDDKREAMEAGAQAYIVKGNFEQGTLLDAVEALIG